MGSNLRRITEPAHPVAKTMLDHGDFGQGQQVPPAADFAAAACMMPVPLCGRIDTVSGPGVVNRGRKCVQCGNPGLDSQSRLFAAKIRARSSPGRLPSKLDAILSRVAVRRETVLVAQQQAVRIGGEPRAASGRALDRLQGKLERITLIKQRAMTRSLADPGSRSAGTMPGGTASRRSRRRRCGPL